jgi:hypothetical protein
MSVKVILTESQFNRIRQIESASNILEESLINSRRIEDLKKTIKRLLYAGVAATAIIAAINKQNMSQTDKDELTQIVLNDESLTEKNAKYDLKIKAVEDYMTYALNNQGYSLNSTKLKPETFVEACETNGFDLPFVMAAAHLESCFGVTRRAKLTNSVFSEGSYDNGKNVVKYSDPNESVYGYIDLLQRAYLVRGKTLSDLMIPGKFVNGIGKRYASDKDYEKKLKNVRDRIIRMYPDLL